MTRARAGTRLYVIAERTRARDEFAPSEPQRDQRASLAATLARSGEQRLAVEREVAGRDGLELR